jgi:hypothetical protein
MAEEHSAPISLFRDVQGNAIRSNVMFFDGETHGVHLSTFAKNATFFQEFYRSRFDALDAPSISYS